MQERIDGRYRLVERLGAGGMAEVWRALDEHTGEEVAVKRLHPHLRTDGRALDRFRREAAAASAVRHPRAVAQRRSRVDAREAYLVMDLVCGPTLATRLAREGALPLAEAAEIARQVAEVLGDAHRRGLVHRDVTPSNVLLDPVAGARLVDFGIARPVEDATEVTAVGDVVGTLRFMAPEVLAGAPATPASDVWSLGAVLYEMLAGRPPFSAESPAALLASQRRPPPSIQWLPAGVSGLLERMLHPDPAMRPANGAAVEAALRQAVPPSNPAVDPDATVVMQAPTATMAAVPSRAVVAPTVPAAPLASTASPGVGRPRSGSRIHAPAAAVIGLGLLAVALLAAGPVIDTGLPVAEPGSPLVSSTPSPTAAPEAEGAGAGQTDDDGDRGRDKGKKRGHDNGKGSGKGGGAGNGRDD